MSAPAHTALSAQQFLTKNITIPHVPLTLYTRSCPQAAFFLFPKIKNVLKGKRFADVGEVQQKMAEALKVSKSMSSKTVWSSGKNILIGLLKQMESTKKVTEV